MRALKHTIKAVYFSAKQTKDLSFVQSETL